MPVTPFADLIRGPGQIRVTGRNDELIFEGEGQFIDEHIPGVPGGRAVLQVQEGNYRARVDLTDLFRTREYSVTPVFESRDVTWEPQPDDLLIPIPQVIRTEVRIDIDPGFARSMRQELYAGHPDHQGTSRQEAPAFDEVYRQIRGPWAGPTMAELNQMLRRVYEAYGVPPEMVGRPDDHADPGSPPDWDEEFRRREKLIASTRAEFPYDPYDYGRVHPRGPSRWTPPADPDEKIRSCP